MYLLWDFSNWKFSWTAFDDNTGFANIIVYMETALGCFPCHPLTFTPLFVHFANRNELFPCSRLSCIVIHKLNLLSHSLRYTTKQSSWNRKHPLVYTFDLDRGNDWLLRCWRSLYCQIWCVVNSIKPLKATY